MPTSILIVKLSSLGDVLHTLPAAQLLRAAHPGARIAWAIERTHAPLLSGQSFLDEVIPWERRDLATFREFIGRLRQTRWDVAIDFQNLLRSAVVTWLSGARRRIGYRPAKELAHWLYNDRVPLLTADRHAVEKSLDLAARLGATMPPGLPLTRPYLLPTVALAPAAASPALGPQLFPLHPSADDEAIVAHWCREQRFDPAQQQLVALNPHCRKNANRWPTGHFTALARRLLQRPNVRVALVGGPVSTRLCDEIAAPLADSSNPILRADGRFGLLQSTALLARARVVVTGDTGPMHLAVAVGTPVVALFGPANALRTGPYASDAVVLDKHLPCAPCFARRCPLKHVPPLCMDQITVDEVLAAVWARLNGQSQAAPLPELRKSA